MPPKSASQKMAEYEEYAEKNRPTGADYKEPMLSCGASCAKKTLLTLNVVFLALGAVIIGVGVWVLQSDVAEVTSESLAYGIICVGCIVVLLASLGCCGAVANSKLLLNIYILFLVLLILCQIIIGSLILADKSRADSLIQDGWDNASAKTQCDLQNSFKCCGLKDPTETLCTQSCDASFPPCMDKLKDEFEKNNEILGAVGVAFALFEIFGVIMGLCLRRGIDDLLEQKHLDDAA